MGWSYGHDSRWGKCGRDIGYSVPAYCDHPSCGAVIDRGLVHVCGGEPYGGERGCGLYFCAAHLTPTLCVRGASQLCDRCYPRIRKAFAPTLDHPTWIRHKLTDPSWGVWRKSNPDEVARLELL